MPSLKPLKSVAHNVAHQFASTLNYWHGDYAINHLAKAAETQGAKVVVIDVLSGKIDPPQVRQGVVAEISAALRSSLGRLLTNEGFTLEQVSEASLTFNFDVPRKDLLYKQPTYECTSVIVTTEGKRFEAQLTEKNN